MDRLENIIRTPITVGMFESLPGGFAGSLFLVHTMYSPWGQVQHQTTVKPGVHLVSTAGHGGAMISRDALAGFSSALPAVSRYGGQYGVYTCFEEDCEETAVLLELLEQGFEPEKMGFSPGLVRETLLASLRTYNPEYLAARGLA